MPRAKDKPLSVNMKKVWEKFYRGGHITDNELDCAISESEIMLEMLHSKGPGFGVIRRVIALELARLQDYKWGREVFK